MVVVVVVLLLLVAAGPGLLLELGEGALWMTGC
jgi:hypothetical protein